MTGGTRPTLTVIAGPNGSGKSTFTASIRATLGVPVVDPDAIAREINPAAPEQAAVAAGREAIRRQSAYIESGAGFAVETTLSGVAMLRQMEQARQRGFDIALIFIATNNAETNIERVANRVMRGGHSVPDEDVRRRYARSMGNLMRAIELADHSEIIDNSSNQGPRVVLEIEAGTITAQAQDLPRWVTAHLAPFIAQQKG